MEAVTIITTLAGICTVLSYLPQVIHTWKIKQANDVSMGMLVFFLLGMSLWFTAGVLLNNYAMIISNSTTALLCLSVMILKVKYDKNKRKNK